MDYPWSCKDSNTTERLSLVKFYLPKTISLVAEYMFNIHIYTHTHIFNACGYMCVVKKEKNAIKSKNQLQPPLNSLV